MNKKIITLLCICLCSFIVVWNLNVGAEVIRDTIVSSLSSSKTLVKANDKFSITVRIPSGLHNKLDKFKYELTYDSTVFTYLSYSMGQSENKEEVTLTNDIDNGVISAIYESIDDEVILDNGTVITFMFEVKPIYRNETFTFGLTGSDYYDKDGVLIDGSCQGTTVDLFIASTETRLQSLSLSEGTLSPAFNGEIQYYTASVNSATVKIEAVAPEKGTVRNIGTKGLDYGDNTFNIISTAEGGNTRVYKLVITRLDNRNKDNTLKSITGVSNFNPDITEYNITIPSNESSFTAEAITNDSKATISYNPSSKRVLLDYGETKKVILTVSAENGSKREYVLNVTRRDDRNSNNLLQSLSISGANINFDPNTISYKVTLDNKYSTVIINALPQSATSTVTGAGVQNLKEGSNPFTIIVKAENGNEKVYTLVVIRKDSAGNISDLSNNTKLKYLRFNTTSVNIKEGIYSYEISLPNSETMGEIFYETEDSKAIVSLEGNRDLIVGKNYYRIRVTAQNGSTMVYELTVIRQEIQNYVKNNKESILNAINNGTDSTVNISVEHNDTERLVDSTVISALKNSGKVLNFYVFDKNKLLDYSISINGSEITEVKSFDYRLKNVTSNQSKIDALSNAKKTFYLNFEGNKDIPAKAKVKVNIGDTFSQENTLTLYYYNSNTDSLELVEDNLYVNNGYVEFTLKNMGDHILIDKDVMNMSQEDSTTLLIIAGVILGIVLLIILIVFIKRRKSMVKIPNINNDIKQDESKE